MLAKIEMFQMPKSRLKDGEFSLPDVEHAHCEVKVPSKSKAAPAPLLDQPLTR